MQKKTVVFDLDDVIVNETFVRIVEEFIEEKIDIGSIGEEYYIEKAVIKDEKKLKKFYDYISTIDLYDYGVVDVQAIHLLRRLAVNYEVFIFTSFFVGQINEKSGIFAKNKFDFLYKTFPFLKPSNFILGGNKSIVSADYFIDDRIDNLTGNSEVKILYSTYHNKDISSETLLKKNIIRISSMEELEKCIFCEYNLKEMIQIVNDFFYKIFKIRNACCSVEAYLSEKGKKKVSINLKECHYKNVDGLISYLSKRLGFDEGTFTYYN